MRFLVHSGNATYDPTLKKYLFNLDRRIPNPTKMKISKVNFIASTASRYPQVVYLRSDAIDTLIKVKHTLDLTDDNHENSTNVLSVLEETHNIERYRSSGAVMFPIHGHKASTKIDFYFTDNNQILDGIYVVPSQPGVSDAAVLVS